MLKKDAMYVDEVADGDPTVITGAGFQVLTVVTTTGPLTKPVIRKIVQKGTGLQQVSVNPQPGTRMLEIQAGETGPNNTPPGALHDNASPELQAGAGGRRAHSWEDLRFPGSRLPDSGLERLE